MTFSDQQLVTEIRSGSGVAFERLMRRYDRLVYRVAYGFTKDREAAMDVAQETFLKVHGRLAGWRGEGDMKNWIARIAANEALNWKRSARRHPTDPLDEDVFLEPDRRREDDLAAVEIRSSLHRGLANLSPRQRLALVLRYYLGMSAREISGVLECSEGTARNTLFRSLQKLRSMLVESEEAVS